MFQVRAQHGAIFVWRQGDAAAAPEAPTYAAPRRGWSLLTRGLGRSQITWRRPGAAGGGASSVDLAVTGDDGAFSGAVSSGPAVVLGVTGDDGMAAIAAWVPMCVDMAVTGDDGAFSAVATGAVSGGGADGAHGKRRRKLYLGPEPEQQSQATTTEQAQERTLAPPPPVIELAPPAPPAPAGQAVAEAVAAVIASVPRVEPVLDPQAAAAELQQAESQLLEAERRRKRVETFNRAAMAAAEALLLDS